MLERNYKAVQHLKNPVLIFFAFFCPLLVCFIQRNSFFSCHLAVRLTFCFSSASETQRLCEFMQNNSWANELKKKNTALH